MFLTGTEAAPLGFLYPQAGPRFVVGVTMGSVSGSVDGGTGFVSQSQPKSAASSSVHSHFGASQPKRGSHGISFSELGSVETVW